MVVEISERIEGEKEILVMLVINKEMELYGNFDYYLTALILSSKDSSGCGGFTLGFILGPFAIIISLFMGGQECPYCKKSIHKDATVCQHCQNKI